MRSYYRPVFKDYDENDAYYDGRIERYLKLPEGFDPTIPTTARAIVDEAVDNVMPADIAITYPPRSVTKTAEEDADAVRRFGRALYFHWGRESSDINPFRDAAKNLFMHGFACIKQVPDWTLWPVLPDGKIAELESKGDSGKAELRKLAALIKEIRSQNNPLMCRSLPPKVVIVDPTVGRKLWLIEQYEASSEEVKNIYAAYEVDFQDRTGGTRHKHRVHEVWTAPWVDWDGTPQEGNHWILVDEEVRHEGVNPYPWLPYIVKFSGFGRETYNGSPQFKSVGFFTPQVKSLIRAEARRYSQFDAIMSQTAWPVMLLPMEVDIDAFDTDPGAMNSVPESVLEHADKMWMRAPIPSAEALTSIQLLGQGIERGTTQAPIRGARVPGTDSAAQYQQYNAQAQLRLESVRIALQDMVATAVSRALWFIDNVFQDSVSVHVAERETMTQTISPKNIKGRYALTVHFRPNEEAERARKLALANDAIAKGGLSPYDALEFAGFDNPSELIARRYAYDILQQDIVKQAIGKQIALEWGVDVDAIALQEQMKQGEMQALLTEFMQALQMGSMRGVGDPMSANGSPLPNGGGQDPMAALAQQGMGPMPMEPGAPAQGYQLAQPGQMQAV